MTTEKKPIVSVITVCYNAEKYIEGVLETVLNQTYGNYEYVIKDGNSSDRTNEIIEAYKVKFEQKGIQVQHIISKDKGIYDAMNEAVTHCNGIWVNFMNADDRYFTNDVLLHIFEQNSYEDADILYGDAVEAEFGNFYPYPKHMDEIEHKMPFSHQSCFIKTSLMQAVPYDLSYRIGADYDFLLKSYLAGKKFVHVDEIVCIVCREGVSTIDLKDAFIEGRTIREKYGIIEMTEKQFKRKMIFVNIKQFGMHHFPQWLINLIRRYQRVTRGQNQKVIRG